MKKFFHRLLTASLALTACCVPVSALEYDFTGPGSGLFAEPTSDNTIYVAVHDDTNIDRSKTAALIPPRFGSPTSYTRNAGELLTPNLVNQSVGAASVASAGVTAMPSSTLAAPSNLFTVTTTSDTGSYPSSGNGYASVSYGDMWTGYTSAGYTPVTSDLYYNGEYLATLSIPAIGLSVKVYQGTDSSALAKGAGHFTDTSVWDGNVAIAGHNRGVNNHFGKIHTLDTGDRITYTTKLGTRSYQVFSVAKVAVDDGSVLNDSAANILTLVTCVGMNQPSYRWCVQAIEV